MRPLSDLDPWRLYEGAESDKPEDQRELTTGRIPDPLPEHTPLYRWLARLLTRVESTLRARGGEGLRRAIILFWALIGVGGIALIFGPVINKPLSFDDVLDSASLEMVDWVMNDGVIRHDIDQDQGGSFVTRVTERFTAEMRGNSANVVERVLPTQYQGNDLGLEITNAMIDGQAAAISRDNSLTYSTISLASATGEVLSDSHDIVLSYTLRNLATTETDSVTGGQVEQFGWNVFAVDLLQAARGITVEVTLPTVLDDALVRAPMGSVAWLLVGGSSWLEPDEALTRDGRVGYSFSNDQSLPPHTQARITLVFEPGTFVMPPHTALFWVQTFGPLVPLMMLGALLLFALAARAVAWADAHGRPWFIVQAKTPTGLTPMLAAQLLRRPLPQQLGKVLTERPRRISEQWVRRVARIAARTGRPGDYPRAIARYLTASEGSELHARGLRRRPIGYVRDAFIWAPIALTLVQWGLVRQLSEQTVLSVVWWPVAFVCVSTLISLVVLWIALSANPLTHKGALLRQHLRGLELYTEKTQVLGRGPLGDALLAYAVLFGPAREAGEAVVELAAHEIGDSDVARGWRGDDHLRTSAVVAGFVAIALLAGSIVTAATQPYPYTYGYDTTIFDRDMPGTLRTSVNEFHASAELTRDDNGQAVVKVREELVAHFEVGNSVPQLGREWPNLRLGQSLGLRVDAVIIDGEPVPWRQIDRPRSVGVVTEMQNVLEGEYDVQVDYTLTSAAVAADYNGTPADQVRWAALYEHWKYELTWIDHELRGIGIDFTIDSELVNQIIAGGWLTNDYDVDNVLWEEGNALAPWNYAESLEKYQGPMTQLGHQHELPDGSQHFTLELQQGWVGGWAYELTLFSDLGASIYFDIGTFTETSAAQARAEKTLHELPNIVVVTLTILLMIGSFCITIVGRVREARKSSRTLRAYSFVVMPIAGLAQFVLFVWATSDMPMSHERFPLMGWLTLISIVLGGVQLWSVLAKPLAPIR